MEIEVLEVGERNKPELESRANSLAPVAGAKLLEDISKMGFDRGRRKTKVFGQVLCRVPFCDAP